MNNVSSSANVKAERKVAAAAVPGPSDFETTKFGRRRLGRFFKWTTMAIWIVGWPYVFLHKRRERARRRDAAPLPARS